MQWLWPRIHRTDQTLVWYTFKRASKAVFFCKKENSALSEHTCLTNHTIGWDNSKIITTNRRYHQRLCLEAWHINSAHAPLNRDDGGLLPDAYLHLSEKRPLISDHIKGPLVAASRSPLMKALDRSVETLGPWIVTSSVTFILSANQSSIKLWELTALRLRGVSGWWTKFHWNIGQKTRKYCRTKWKHSVLSPKLLFTFL